MATNEERIRIVIETFAKGFGKVMEHRKAFEKMGLSVNKAGRVINASTGKFAKNKELTQKFAQTYDNLGGIMGATVPELKAINNGGVKLGSMWARTGNKVRLMTHGLRGFKMEMLGVMFFGLMLQKAFTGLLKPAAELFGMFDLFRIMLQIMFLPIMALLFPYFLKFFEFFMNLSPEVKMAIGWIVLFGAVLGAILFVVGSVALGIGSVILALGMFASGGALGAAATGATAIGAAFAGLIPILGWVALAIAVIVLLWKTDLGGFQDFVKETFKGIFSGIKSIMFNIWQVVKHAWSLITNLMEGDCEAAMVDIDNIGKEAASGILKAFVILAFAINNIFVWLVNSIKELFTDLLVSYFLYKVKKFISAIGVLPGLGNWAKEAKESVDKVGDSFRETADEMNIPILTMATNEDMQRALQGIDQLTGTQNYAGAVSASDALQSPLLNEIGLFGNQVVDALSTVDANLQSIDTSIAEATTPSSPMDDFYSGLTLNQTNNQTNNIEVIDREELATILDENNKKLAEEIQRMTPTFKT